MAHKTEGMVDLGTKPGGAVEAPMGHNEPYYPSLDFDCLKHGALAKCKPGDRVTFTADGEVSSVRSRATDKKSIHEATVSFKTGKVKTDTDASDGAHCPRCGTRAGLAYCPTCGNKMEKMKESGEAA